MLLAADRVVITDFGVASIRVRGDGELSGTPAYMKFNKTDDEVQAAMDEAALRELPKINARTPYLGMLANFAVMAGLLGTIGGMAVRQSSHRAKP